MVKLETKLIFEKNVPTLKIAKNTHLIKVESTNLLTSDIQEIFWEEIVSESTQFGHRVCFWDCYDINTINEI